MYAEELEKLEYKKACVIVMLDINDFKDVNDTMGHDVGDQYLIKLCTIISSYILNSAMLYRIGGDEFVIISTRESLAQMQLTIEKAKDRAKQEHIIFSYRISYYEPDRNMDESLQLADQLMYIHKKEMKKHKNSND